MSADNGDSPRSPLFARKGLAAPAPAVGYVTVRTLQGKPERRHEEGSYQGPDRRRPPIERIFAPAEAPQLPAPAPAAPAPRQQAAAAAGPLASLIHRHGTPRPPAPTPPPRAETRRQTRPPEPRPAAPPPAPQADLELDLPTPQTTTPPQPPEAHTLGPRHQLTVRVHDPLYRRFKGLTRASGRTNQDVLSAALAAYLDQGVY